MFRQSKISLYAICTFFCLSVIGQVSNLAPATAVAQESSATMGFSGARKERDSSKKYPAKWNAKENIAWKLKLPGPGASSPVIIEDKIVITCYAGYGVDRRKPGNLKNLRRYLICIDRKSGKQVWRKVIRNGKKEDKLTQQISDHGYASSTPVSDGKTIYAFFGKAGVYAFDLKGKQLWKKDVGSGSSRFRQGSGSSPVLAGKLLIINAADEANAIIALDKSNGKIVWRNESAQLDGSYVTPALATTKDQKTQVIVSMINQAWGLRAEDGKQSWKMATRQNGSVVPTPIVDKDKVYLFGGMEGRLIARILMHRGR